MLPSFISMELAEMILVIGKSINFMMQCSKSSQVSNNNNNTLKSLSIESKKDQKSNKSKRKEEIQKENKNFNNNNNIQNIEEITTTGIKVIKSDIPNEVDSDLTIKNNSNINDNAFIDSDLYFALRTLSYGGRGEHQLNEAVRKVAQDTDTKLLQLLREQFHLEDHLLAMKKFLLLGQVKRDY